MMPSDNGGPCVLWHGGEAVTRARANAMPDQQPDRRSQAVPHGAPRPASEEAVAQATLAALVAAAVVARAGEPQRARELCAAVVFATQPMIAVRADLLRATLHALLTARGFKLLSRLVLAMSGRKVQVELTADCSGPIAPPRSLEAVERTIYRVDPRWLDRLAPGDMFLRQWCDALIARPRGHADAAASGSIPRLQPA
jgi:hypothetical protein